MKGSTQYAADQWEDALASGDPLKRRAFRRRPWSPYLLSSKRSIMARIMLSNTNTTGTALTFHATHLQFHADQLQTDHVPPISSNQCRTTPT
jgi:hypothetical protein